MILDSNWPCLDLAKESYRAKLQRLTSEEDMAKVHDQAHETVLHGGMLIDKRQQKLFSKFIITILIRVLSHSLFFQFFFWYKIKRSLQMTSTLKYFNDCFGNVDILNLISIVPSMTVIQNEYILEIWCTVLCL